MLLLWKARFNFWLGNSKSMNELISPAEFIWFELFYFSGLLVCKLMLIAKMLKFSADIHFKQFLSTIQEQGIFPEVVFELSLRQTLEDKFIKVFHFLIDWLVELFRSCICRLTNFNHLHCQSISNFMDIFLLDLLVMFFQKGFHSIINILAHSLMDQWSCLHLPHRQGFFQFSQFDSRLNSRKSVFLIEKELIELLAIGISLLHFFFSEVSPM